MSNKDYLIKFNDDGSRNTTYANNIHYKIIEPKAIIEIDSNKKQNIIGYTEKEIINLIDNFDYQKCLNEGFEWISNEDYQKLLGNFDGNEYIKSNNTFIPKPPYIPSLDKLKKIKLKEAGKLFAEKRDSIRWIKIDDLNTYGFDCASEDIINFTAAYIGLSNDLTKNGTTFYKVWLTPETKGIVSLNLGQMTTVYNTVRNAQFEAYTWYEQIKQKINNCQSKEDLNSINIE